MAVWAFDLALLSLVALWIGSDAKGASFDLAKLFQNRHNQMEANKRKVDFGKDGNPCPMKEKPFPCKTGGTCIPMSYVCDKNWDCDDGYDEDKEVCTAAHRPPIEIILEFLDSEKGWILPLFGNKNMLQIAHALAVSGTVDDFAEALALKKKDTEVLRAALEAVENTDQETMEMLGMPSGAWNEVVFFFTKLLKSGFNN